MQIIHKFFNSFHGNKLNEIFSQLEKGLAQLLKVEKCDTNKILNTKHNTAIITNVIGLINEHVIKNKQFLAEQIKEFKENQNIGEDEFNQINPEKLNLFKNINKKLSLILEKLISFNCINYQILYGFLKYNLKISHYTKNQYLQQQTYYLLAQLHEQNSQLNQSMNSSTKNLDENLYFLKKTIYFYKKSEIFDSEIELMQQKKHYFLEMWKNKNQSQKKMVKFISNIKSHLNNSESQNADFEEENEIQEISSNSNCAFNEDDESEDIQYIESDSENQVCEEEEQNNSNIYDYAKFYNNMNLQNNQNINKLNDSEMIQPIQHNHENYLQEKEKAFQTVRNQLLKEEQLFKNINNQAQQEKNTSEFVTPGLKQKRCKYFFFDDDENYQDNTIENEDSSQKIDQKQDFYLSKIVPLQEQNNFHNNQNEQKQQYQYQYQQDQNQQSIYNNNKSYNMINQSQQNYNNHQNDNHQLQYYQDQFSQSQNDINQYFSMGDSQQIQQEKYQLQNTSLEEEYLNKDIKDFQNQNINDDQYNNQNTNQNCQIQNSQASVILIENKNHYNIPSQKNVQQQFEKPQMSMQQNKQKQQINSNQQKMQAYNNLQENQNKIIDKNDTQSTNINSNDLQQKQSSESNLLESLKSSEFASDIQEIQQKKISNFQQKINQDTKNILQYESDDDYMSCSLDNCFQKQSTNDCKIEDNQTQQYNLVNQKIDSNNSTSTQESEQNKQLKYNNKISKISVLRQHQVQNHQENTNNFYSIKYLKKKLNRKLIQKQKIKDGKLKQQESEEECIVISDNEENYNDIENDDDDFENDENNNNDNIFELPMCNKHSKFQLNMMCIKKNCKHQGLTCAKCMIQFHNKNHDLQKDIICVEEALQELQMEKIQIKSQDKYEKQIEKNEIQLKINKMNCQAYQVVANSNRIWEDSFQFKKFIKIAADNIEKIDGKIYIRDLLQDNYANLIKDNKNKEQKQLNQIQSDKENFNVQNYKVNLNMLKTTQQESLNKQNIFMESALDQIIQMSQQIQL